MRAATLSTVCSLIFAVACCPGCGRQADLPLPSLEKAEPVVREAVQEAHRKASTDGGSYALRELGDMYRLLGWNREAAEVYRVAGEARPDEFIWPYLQGVALEQFDLEGAEKALAKAVELDGAYPPARLRLGKAHSRRGAVAEARQQLEKATELAPENPHAWLALGQLFLIEGETDEARNALGKALVLAPDLRDAHRAMAQLSLAAGDTTRAARHDARAQELIDAATRTDDPRAGMVVTPVGSIANIRRGRTLAAAGNLEAAVEHYRRAIESRPELPEFHTSLGEVYALLDRLDEAEQEYLAALELNPDYDTAIFRLGRVYFRTGRFEKAATQFHQVLALDPSHGGAMMHMGILAAREDREAEAVDWFEAGLVSRPDHIDTRFNYAVALANFERWSEAVQQLEIILDANPDHRQARAMLERVQAQESTR
jgi:tetratricopeptide (TPR) repeat protein